MSPHKAFSGSRTSQIICIGYLLCILLFSQRIYLTNSLLKRGSSSRTGVAKAMTAVIFFPLGSPPPVWEICFSFLYTPKYLKFKKKFFFLYIFFSLRWKRKGRKKNSTGPSPTVPRWLSSVPSQVIRGRRSQRLINPQGECAPDGTCADSPPSKTNL